MTEALAEVTVFFALVLALALLIERVLEILKAAYDLVDSRFNWYPFWTRRARTLKETIERRMRVFEYVGPEAVRAVLNRVYDLVQLTPQGAPGAVPVLSGDLVRASAVKLGCKVVGMGLGVAVAFWLSIDLVTIWQSAEVTLAATTYWAPPWLRLVVSGAIIGLGAGPVHKLITTIERKRGEKEAKGGAS